MQQRGGLQLFVGRVRGRGLRRALQRVREEADAAAGALDFAVLGLGVGVRAAMI